MSEQSHGGWKRMRFKGNKVWMAVEADGAPALEKGRVLIKYQLDQPHEYRVARSSVRDLDDPEPPAPATKHRAKPSVKQPPARTPAVENPKGQILIFTDGAASGNPGPAGIGVVLIYGTHKKTISRSIGRSTNNIAELTAIQAGLEAVKNRRVPVKVHTDSSYALGLLALGWKAKANQALVAQIRQLAATFSDLEFIKVKGHAGHPENEEADRLAVAAANQTA